MRPSTSSPECGWKEGGGRGSPRNLTHHLSLSLAEWTYPKVFVGIQSVQFRVCET